MRKRAKGLLGMTALATILSAPLMAMPVQAAEGASTVDEGKALAFDRKKGNCLACHQIEGGGSPGNIGPPLMSMKQRFPERKRLVDQLWDATQFNPDSIMPPFGRHKALNKAEMEKIIDFLYTL